MRVVVSESGHKSLWWEPHCENIIFLFDNIDNIGTVGFSATLYLVRGPEAVAV